MPGGQRPVQLRFGAMVDIGRPARGSRLDGLVSRFLTRGVIGSHGDCRLLGRVWLGARERGVRKENKKATATIARVKSYTTDAQEQLVARSLPWPACRAIRGLVRRLSVASYQRLEITALF